MRGDKTNEARLEEPVQRLVDLAREELGEMSARKKAEGFVALTARRSPARSVRRVALGFAAALTIAALLLVGGRFIELHHGTALSYAVESGKLAPGGEIERSGDDNPLLRFSDGTEVMFLDGGTGRVRSVGEHGARVTLIGKAKIDVVHWRASRWLFDAGPFLITVTGTSFTAEWRDSDERLEVVLEKGSVAVSGPLSDEAITLRAGQRLVISTRAKEVVIRDIDSSTESRSAPSAVPPQWTEDDNAPAIKRDVSTAERTHRAPAPPPQAANPSPSSGATAHNWSAELAAGHFATILQQAEQRGLETSLADVSSDDLAALADAARYSRRDDVARRALTAQRQRFPGGARANDAAFLLGRLEEAAQHPELALGWYDRCLTESARGTYISEALGRKMTVVQRLYGAERARPIAEEYLRRFDGGTYAKAARALTRVP
jgi:hypothetical protein